MKASSSNHKLGGIFIAMMAFILALPMIGASGLAIDVPGLDQIQPEPTDGHLDTVTRALPATSAMNSASTVTPVSESAHVDSGPDSADSLQPLPNSNQVSPEKFTAEMTWFETGLGSCGKWNNGNDHICAISQILYNRTNIDGNPNHNPVCGRRIHLQRGARSIEVSVADNCPECPEHNIDVTKSVFQALGNLDEGRIKIEWHWL